MGHFITMAALEGTATGLEGVATGIAFAFQQLATMVDTIKGEPILLLVVVGLPVSGWVITRGKSLFHK